MMFVVTISNFINTIGKAGRAAGYAQAAAMQGIAYALPKGFARAAVRRAFARNLVSMRGVPMKMTQILSMSGSRQGSLYAEALAELPPVPSAAILEHLRAIAPAIHAAIATFDPAGIPASLGQVHRARLKDGRDCAIKIRYPGIAAGIGLDVATMNLLLGMFQGFGEGFSLAAYREMFARELAAEMDYRAEAAHQAWLRKEFPAGAGIIIPKPYPYESGDGVILMDWEGSLAPARFAAEANADAKRQAMEHFSAFLMRSVFGRGLVHADPNPGNFGFRPSATGTGTELVVYDYGSVIELPPALPAGLLALLRAVRDGADPLPALLALGFAPEPLEPIRDRLGAFCELVFAPFLSAHPLDAKAWNRKEKAASLLGSQRWNFMIAAPVAVFPLLRALHGLVHYSGLLGAPMHLRPAVDALLNAEGSGSERIPAPQARCDAPESRKLRVEVRRGHTVSVSLTFPGGAVQRLPSLLDPELLARIEARGIGLDSIMQAARDGGYGPMDLFSCEYAGKTVAVWLE
jgi:hypothetical protein